MRAIIMSRASFSSRSLTAMPANSPLRCRPPSAPPSQHGRGLDYCCHVSPLLISARMYARRLWCALCQRPRFRDRNVDYRFAVGTRTTPPTSALLAGVIVTRNDSATQKAARLQIDGTIVVPSKWLSKMDDVRLAVDVEQTTTALVQAGGRALGCWEQQQTIAPSPKDPRQMLPERRIQERISRVSARRGKRSWFGLA